MMTPVITETGLPHWRAGFSCLDYVVAGTISVLPLAPGVGKSHSADRALNDPATYAKYDLVIYCAPLRLLLDDRLAALASAPGRRGRRGPAKVVVLRPRPRALCGDLDAAWLPLEQAGCAALGKDKLCATCPARAGCAWPERLSEANLRGARLILMTEQQLLTNPRMVRLLRERTGARRVLVLLDEARFIDAPFTVRLPRHDLTRFRDVLAAVDGLEERVRETWLRSLGRLLAGEDPRRGLAFPRALLAHAGAIQAAGVHAHGARFKFLGHQLADFRRSRVDDRWIDEDGALRFELIPELAGDVLVLSAYLEAGYVAHRLDVANVASPLAGLRVAHTGTRLYNLKSRLGTETYFPGNSPQLLDFFAALIARNIAAGRTSVVVTRKKFAELCTAGLVERLAALGHAVRFVRAPFDGLGAPDPRVVPVETYGLMGINSLADYESCFCLNGFFVPPSALDEAVQGAVPDRHKVPLEIHVSPTGTRRVRAAEPGFGNGPFLAMADACLQKLELEPALQAAARVRFNVRPREVWFFTMHDVAAAVGMPVHDVFSLKEAYAAAGVARPRAVARAAQLARVRALLEAGASQRQAARALEVSHQTVSRWLKEACHDFPLLDLPGGAS